MPSSRTSLLSLLCAATLACGALSASATSVASTAAFNFDSEPAGNGPLGFSETNNGLTAEFITVGGLCGVSGLSPLSGIAVSTAHCGGEGTTVMQFFSPLTSISFDYATFGRSPVDVLFLDDGAIVGDETLGSPNRRHHPYVGTETFSYDGTFDTVIIELDGQGADYAVDNLSATFLPTPEPSSIILLGTGMLGFAGVVRRRFTI